MTIRTRHSGRATPAELGYDPWDAAFGSPVWARALGHALPTSKSAASSVSKAWLRLEQRNLIKRARVGRKASVTLLREDGSVDGRLVTVDDADNMAGRLALVLGLRDLLASPAKGATTG